MLYLLITGCHCRISDGSMARQRPCGDGSNVGVRPTSGSASGVRRSLPLIGAANSIGAWLSSTGRSRPPRTGAKVGLMKKGKGTKWMLVVDVNGLPLGFHLDSANRAEVRLAEQTLDTYGWLYHGAVPSNGPEGRCGPQV